MSNDRAAEPQLEKDQHRANRDPITGEPGSHPVGAGLGAVGGTLAGAALGIVAGPVGVLAGAIVGGFAGGMIGDQIGEEVNPTAEDLYWQEAYKSEPYYKPDYSFDDYAPAYRLGNSPVAKTGEQLWNRAQLDSLRNEWESKRGGSRLSWDDAQLAARAARDRVERLPGA